MRIIDERKGKTDSRLTNMGVLEPRPIIYPLNSITLDILAELEKRADPDCTVLIRDNQPLNAGHLDTVLETNFRPELSKEFCEMMEKRNWMKIFVRHEEKNGFWTVSLAKAHYAELELG